MTLNLKLSIAEFLAHMILVQMIMLILVQMLKDNSGTVAVAKDLCNEM